MRKFKPIVAKDAAELASVLGLSPVDGAEIRLSGGTSGIAKSSVAMHNHDEGERDGVACGQTEKGHD